MPTKRQRYDEVFQCAAQSWNCCSSYAHVGIDFDEAARHMIDELRRRCIVIAAGADQPGAAAPD